MNQLEIHKKIDEFFKSDVQTDSFGIAREILSSGAVVDTRNYFFAQADEKWLDWLWQNDFLKAIEEKADDITKYSFAMPELGYLARMTEKNPEKVAEIIEKTSISKSNFNPEVIDRFWWIISSLPASQIKKLTKKMRDENWVYLMKDFNKSGYEFDKMVKRLAEAKEYDALLELAEAILAVKSSEEISQKDKYFSLDQPFYIHDISASGIFIELANIDDSRKEKALKITTDIMGKIVRLAGKDKDNVFEFKDVFALYDVDFFELNIEDRRGGFDREDIKNLAATIKKLVEKTVGTKCDESVEAKKLFNKYINNLPESRSVWRLKLFTLAQCPEVFKEELTVTFLRVFNVGERYFEIKGGAEYHQALIKCFGVIDQESQRKYVQKVFDYFSADIGDEDMEKRRKRDGAKILCFIKDYLTPEEKREAKKKFGISPDKIECVPEPTIVDIKGGTVHHQSPVNLADYTIDQIIEKLKSEWTPEKLSEQFKGDDFLNPRGPEGLGEALKADFKERVDDYLDKLPKFFDRKNIDPSYLYSILRGVEEVLRDKNSFNEKQVGQILDLFKDIRLSVESEAGEFKRENRKEKRNWLADWIIVHKVITDILLYILENKDNREKIHKKYRNELKNIIEYLFTIQDSPNREEEGSEYGELFHIAINSVRGRAFQVFVVFIENDGKLLSNDAKKLYKKVLGDNSLVIRFVIGHYLASFYFRDKDFISSLFPQIFPKDNPDKKDIYLATWEGYLANTLYEQLFDSLEDYYIHAIKFDPKNYTKRKYFKGLDESLAVHIALAFIHFGLKMGDKIFDLFWSTPNTIRHKEFISFIGRHCITRDQAGDSWFKENNVDKNNLLKFWDWALENITDPKVFSGFGYWINQNKEILSDKIVVQKIAETLKKSSGDISWDYGLLKRLAVFAEKDPQNTFEIIKNYYLDKKKNLNRHHQISIYEDDVKEALEIVYKKISNKQEIIDFINILIEKGSSIFWGLKDIFKEEV